MLAGHLGMGLNEVRDKVNAREFAYWRAWYEVEPFGEAREDLRMGIICATITNSNRGKKGRRFKPDDFIPDFERAHRRQSVNQMQTMLLVFANIQNKKTG